MENVLKVSNLIKKYGAITALNGVSFEVPAGSIFGILGPNGSGKTTLLGILTDVLKSTSGSFSWFNGSDNDEQRKKIGTLLETPNFYSYLTATQNLEISALIKGGDGKDIPGILETMGLSEKKEVKFSSFSLGMKQRLSIAAALCGMPKVLILDEPTNALDPEGIALTRSLIKKANAEGKTVIIASHILDEVEKICTHVAVLKQGKLLVTGPVNEILSNDDIVEIGGPDLEAIAKAFRDFPKSKRLVVEKKLVILVFPKGESQFGKIAQFCAERGLQINHLQARVQNLEEKYFEITKKS